MITLKAPPSSTVLAEYFLSLLNGIDVNFFAGTAFLPDSTAYLSTALSVAFPPYICTSTSFSEITASVLLYMLSRSLSATPCAISAKFLLSSALPSTNVTASSLPLVIVPVLSLKSMFKLPAVSIPTIFLTSTLSLSILPIFKADTSATIRGSPSGTAITMIMTASITAFITSLTTVIQSEKYAAICAPSKLLLTRTD